MWPHDFHSWMCCIFWHLTSTSTGLEGAEQTNVLKHPWNFSLYFTCCDLESKYYGSCSLIKILNTLFCSLNENYLLLYKIKYLIPFPSRVNFILIGLIFLLMPSPLGILQFVIEYCSAPFLRASAVNSTASVARGRSLLENTLITVYLLCH